MMYSWRYSWKNPCGYFWRYFCQHSWNNPWRYLWSFLFVEATHYFWRVPCITRKSLEYFFKYSFRKSNHPIITQLKIATKITKYKKISVKVTKQSKRNSAGISSMNCFRTPKNSSKFSMDFVLIFFQ